MAVKRRKLELYNCVLRETDIFTYTFIKQEFETLLFCR